VNATMRSMDNANGMAGRKGGNKIKMAMVNNESTLGSVTGRMRKGFPLGGFFQDDEKAGAQKDEKRRMAVCTSI